MCLDRAQETSRFATRCFKSGVVIHLIIGFTVLASFLLIRRKFTLSHKIAGKANGICPVSNLLSMSTTATRERSLVGIIYDPYISKEFGFKKRTELSCLTISDEMVLISESHFSSSRSLLVNFSSGEGML